MMKSGLSGKDKARERALKKLSTRERTEKEILDFLCGEGCTSVESKEIVAEFKEWGYLDDERYCRRYFEYGRSKGKAAARIIRELVQKGISADKARDVLSDMNEESDGGKWEDDKCAALSVGMIQVNRQMKSFWRVLGEGWQVWDMTAEPAIML